MGSTSCEPYLCIIFRVRFACAVRVSLSKICILSVFAQTFNVGQNIYFITFVFSFVQEFGNEKSKLEGLIKQVKNNADKKERHFGVMLTPFSSSKCSLINCEDDTETSFFIVRVVFYLFLCNWTGSCLLNQRKSYWFQFKPPVHTLDSIFGNRPLLVQFVHRTQDYVSVRFTWNCIQAAIWEFYGILSAVAYS